MTADATWPYATLVPRTPYPRLAGTSMSGGRSLSGKLQTVGVDAPFWLITLGGIPIRNDTHIEAWRVVELALDGRLGTCLVPFYDGKRAPWPNGMGGATIVASADGAMAVGATSGAIDMTTGAAPKPGMFWSAGERGYQLKTVGAPTGTIYPVTFRPPLREAIADNDPLEFAHPVVRCRLRDDDGMCLDLELHQFATKTVEFEEDV
jgi:hypothetical protein